MPKARTPTKMLLDRGSKKGRDRDKHEIKPGLGLGLPPDWLNENARKHWGQICPQLRKLGIYASTDEISLSMLVNTLGDYIEFDQIIRREGYTLVSKKGVLYQHPILGMRNRAHAQLLKLLMQFGLTPSTRSTISTVDAQGESTTLDALLDG